MDFSIVILVLWAVSLLWYRRDARRLASRLEAVEDEMKLLSKRQEDIKLKNAGVRRSVGTSDFH